MITLLYIDLEGCTHMTIVGVELNNENSTMVREGKVRGERQVSDKRSENAVYAWSQSRQEVHNAIFLREIVVYKTCPTIGINSNSERCLNEIDTRRPNSLGSFYEATSHARKREFARETSSVDRFTKVIANRKSKITLKISLRARIRAFH